jgi:NAD(P)-dependent dehydrogenase (short-subunit alcohol dehydrogenase family)
MRQAGQDQSHRTALVTGATGAIGRAIALQIARQPLFRVVLLCRDPHKADQAVSAIIEQTGNQHVGYETVDVSSKDSMQLRAGAPARVVNVASYWAGDLDLDDLEFKRRPYNNDTAYRQSKQANRMLTVAFARRLGEHGVTVNACHPGDVNSALSNNLGFGGHESPQEGARTPAWLATDDIGQQETGKYFEHMQMRRCRFGEDREKVEALYRACLAY